MNTSYLDFAGTGESIASARGFRGARRTRGGGEDLWGVEGDGASLHPQNGLSSTGRPDRRKPDLASDRRQGVGGTDAPAQAWTSSFGVTVGAVRTCQGSAPRSQSSARRFTSALRLQLFRHPGDEEHVGMRTNGAGEQSSRPRGAIYVRHSKRESKRVSSGRAARRACNTCRSRP